MPTLLPDWIFDKSCTEETLVAMGNDLVFTAKQKILESLNFAPKDESSQRRLETKAIMETISAMINMSGKRRKYIMWAMVQLQEKGLWQYADEEYETIEELVRSIAAQEEEKNPGGGASCDWSFIAQTLVPTMRQHGISSLKAIAMLDNNGKLRAAVPKMRLIIERSLPEHRAQEIEAVLEKVLDPAVSNDVFRHEVHVHKVAPTSPIPATAAAFYLSSPQGGGIITIQVQDKAQLVAVERATAGLFEKPDTQFYPRDITALAKQVTTVFNRLPPPLSKPLSPEETFAKAQGSILSAVILVPIEEFMHTTGYTAILNATTQVPGDLDIVTCTVLGHEGNNLSLFVQINLTHALRAELVGVRSESIAGQL